MKIQDCHISGLKVIELEIHGDSRGFFVERFNEKKFAAASLPTRFVQDNHSRSAAGILRGLHFQNNPGQGKLVGVMQGKVWDVAVDIRPESKTFGQHFGVELSAENGKLLWIPAGFAHGFCVLGDAPADMLYKVTEFYNAAGEGGIAYNDAQLAINWPIGNPAISERDRQLASWDEYCKNIRQEEKA